MLAHFRIGLATIVFLAAGVSARAAGKVGFQQVTVPDSLGKTIAVGIWYPTSSEVSANKLGFFTQDVALNGTLAGDRLPLVLISHGVYGSMASHYDTAIALAEGYVVAAPTHIGDSSIDQSYLAKRIDLIDRPRQLKVVLEWMLGSWPDRGHLDTSRVGVFGFSLGGFTALVEIGGTPELGRMGLLCATHTDAPECAFIKQNHGDQLDANPPKPVWAHDSRIKAAVIAAPAVSFLFGPEDLREVRVPVQLWRAERDTNAPDETNSGLVRKELPRKPEEHVVPGGDHFVFLAPCSEAFAAAVPSVCKDAAGFDRAAFHREFNTAVVKFFDKELERRP